MKTQKIKIGNLLSVFAVCILVFIGVHTGTAQQIRWLRITSLQSPINEIGAEFENEFTASNSNIFSWPAQYSIDQNTMRCRGLWLGCMNFMDPMEGKLKVHKVIDVGPRVGTYNTKIFPKVIKLIGKDYHPIVTVDGNLASVLDSFDKLDEVDTRLKADRMILVKFNTSMGISVTKKVMAFDQSNNDNYFVKDFVFTNTGIYDSVGSVKKQTLDSVYFYFCDRYSFAGVSCTGYNQGWGSWNSTWGESNLIHTIGEDPTAPGFEMRAAYTWYGPDFERKAQVSYDEDWGDPAQTEDGELAAAKYAGSVALHADKSASDTTDDLYQPSTNNYISSDGTLFNKDQSQYDEAIMADRWAAITDGHPTIQWDVRVGDNYPKNVIDPRRNTGGGAQPEMAFGPYQMAPGDSIHIAMAEAVAGISWEKGREVGGKWLQWRNSTGTPVLVMPDGSTTTDYNLYKRKWCETGKDSILQTYRNAIRNYKLGYNIAKALPPKSFTVTSGGKRILLEWEPNDEGGHFNGYVIYRSAGTVLDRKTVYEKIFECSKANVVHSFEDITATRGFDYYYYIQTKDDGTQNDVHPGVPLYSSMFWTVTNVAATLQQPAEPVTPYPPSDNSRFWKLVTNYRGNWVADTSYNGDSHDVVSYQGSFYICTLSISDTTKPLADTTHHWRLVSTKGDSVAFDKGTWILGSSYADTTHDIVSYNGLSYICKANISQDSIAPDVDKARWKLQTSRGSWISGSHYNANDLVTYSGSRFVTLYAIASGKGLDLVRVVPNPYDIRARFFQFGDQSQYDRIAFYGLPGECKLKIFTERGDLIREINHSGGTGDELWDSKTSSGQIIVSGIYILYVEAPGQGSVFRKFVVIR
jgi:hypothetical protein